MDKRLKSENDLSGSSAKSIIRLLNFIIDTFVWLILYLSFAYIFDLYFFRFRSYLINYIYSISLGLILYLAYYCILEFSFQRTFGKFLTRTKVISKYGGEITFPIIVIRTISRLIPIDILCFLFSKNGLHDKLSNTLVIKTNANNV
ncbi:RDD family protein [Hyunsoonleella aestuarii]